MPAGGDGEAGGHREPTGRRAGEVLAGVHAGAERDGERQEGEPGLQRRRCRARSAGTARQQEGAEQGGGGREHHDQAAADGAVGETLDAQQRLGGAHVRVGEGRVRRAPAVRRIRASARRSSRRLRPVRARRPGRRGWRWPAARRGRSRPRHSRVFVSAGGIRRRRQRARGRRGG